MDFKSLKTNKGNLMNGIIALTPKKYEDSRGFFYESWNSRKFNEILNKKVDFVQDNHSRSKKGVLRGLHFQIQPNAQGKLVRCIYGEIYDVAVDLRINSKTFGEWTSALLGSRTQNQLWIPEGFAHGFLTLSDYAEVIYKTNNFWNKYSEKSLKWNDEELRIEWPLEKLEGKQVLISDKDSNASSLEDIIKNSQFYK
tara:strand:+ start:9797 stop:10387 length:591 start_codon:yes stop_codon:yes gene_type:complete